MTFKYRYRKQIIMGICILVLISGGGFFLFKNIYKEKPKKKKLAFSNIVKETSKKIDKEASLEILVDIKGMVASPGTYSMHTTDRVINAINMAGGLLDNADTTVLNLSKKLTDEMVIIVYSKSEVENFKKTKEVLDEAYNKCSDNYDNAIKNDACINSETKSNDITTTTTVSINSATKEELMTLSGIGESKAQDIIKYREANGGFKTIEDLKNVSGIGEATFAKIKENITL